MAEYFHISATGSGQVTGGTGSHSTLTSVAINTAGAGAVLTVYDGTDAGGNVVAVIDAGSAGTLWFDVDCHNGIFFALATTNADITIGYE
jgi:hypothetical protein